MFCPECGTRVNRDGAACPNGHRIATMTAVAVSAARRLGAGARPALSLRVPSVEEAWPVVMLMKLVAWATLIVGVLQWRSVSQFLTQLGAPGALGQVVGVALALGAFALGLALYGLALVVQTIIARDRGRNAEEGR